MRRVRVGILGATGMAGQRYVSLLAEHPWFELVWLGASPGSAGKSYEQAVAGRWRGGFPLPPKIAQLVVQEGQKVGDTHSEMDLLFSAVGSDIAKDLEWKAAEAGLAVVSNASANRQEIDVPVVIPEVNPEHLQVISLQRKNRGWNGFVVAKPNCSVQSYMATLFALDSKFGVEKLIVTTLQALSGAGHPGVSSLDILDNVIPWIPGEEEKSEREPLKILGSLQSNGITPREGLAIAAHCNRVATLDGHLACVSVGFRTRPSREEIEECWDQFERPPSTLGLPSAPPRALILRKENDRPQPRIDREAGGGMTVTLGRLRPCPVLDWRFVGLSHNTLRGAAGGGVLIAELLYKEGWLDS